MFSSEAFGLASVVSCQLSVVRCYYKEEGGGDSSNGLLTIDRGPLLHNQPSMELAAASNLLDDFDPILVGHLD